MKIVSLIAHPRPESFCHAVSERARAALVRGGHEVDHHDLYAERFDPCLTAEEAYTIGKGMEASLAGCTDPIVHAHREAIRAAEGLLVVHPNWWGKPPAILAGWLDRVLVPGVAYRLAEAAGPPEGLLALRRALILNTSDTPSDREESEFGDPLDDIWGRCVLPFCGTARYHRQVFRPVVGSSAAVRSDWLSKVDVLVDQAFGET